MQYLVSAQTSISTLFINTKELLGFLIGCVFTASCFSIQMYTMRRNQEQEDEHNHFCALEVLLPSP